MQTQLSEATRQAAEEFEKAHPELVKNLRTTGDVGAFLADFTPIIGDIKSFVEAENGIDYTNAGFRFNSNIRIFGKGEVNGHRRLGVLLARDISVEKALEKVERAYAKLDVKL